MELIHLVLIEQWRRRDNTLRPHSACGYSPCAPQTIIAQRDDPHFAIEGLPADPPASEPYECNLASGANPGWQVIQKT